MTTDVRPDEVGDLIEKRKMYVVTRRDLPPGLRAAQAGHAVAEMCLGYAMSSYGWNSDPDGNYLIILEAHDEFNLVRLYSMVRHANIPAIAFHEPDLAGEMTAFAALPEPEQNRIFADLPLAYSRRSLWERAKDYFGLGDD